MDSVLNIHSNAEMEFLKMVGQQRYTNQLYGSPLDIIITLKHGESPNTNNKRFLQPCYSLDFKKQVCKMLK